MQLNIHHKTNFLLTVALIAAGALLVLWLYDFREVRKGDAAHHRAREELAYLAEALENASRHRQALTLYRIDAGDTRPAMVKIEARVRASLQDAQDIAAENGDALAEAEFTALLERWGEVSAASSSVTLPTQKEATADIHASFMKALWESIEERAGFSAMAQALITIQQAEADFLALLHSPEALTPALQANAAKYAGIYEFIEAPKMAGVQDITPAPSYRAAMRNMQGVLTQIAEGNKPSLSEFVLATSTTRAAAAERWEKEIAEEIAAIERRMETSLAYLLIYIVLLAGLVAAGLAALRLSRRIASRPLLQLRDTMAAISQGKLERNVPYTQQQDSLGELARLVENFRDSAVDMRRQQDAAQISVMQRMERQQRIERMLSVFEQRVVLELKGLLDSAKDLIRSVEGMAIANRQRQALFPQDAFGDAKGGSGYWNEVVEVMAMHTERVHQVSQAVMHRVAEAQKQAHGMVISAEKMEEMVMLINQVTSRINILALNATIESARAGGAGRGFAILATEVKSLAGQTGEAAEIIAGQLSNVRQGISHVADDYLSLDETMREMNEISVLLSEILEAEAPTDAQQKAVVGGVTADSTMLGSAFTRNGEATPHPGDDAENPAANVLQSVERFSLRWNTLNEEVAQFFRNIEKA